YYIDKDDIVTAIKYMIKAGDKETALENIDKNFNQIFNEGKIEFLWEWMNAIDEELINENPGSLIHFGILKRYYSGDLNTSLVYFDKAINMLKGSADYSLIINAHVNKAAVMRNLARTAEVIKEFETLIADARYA